MNNIAEVDEESGRPHFQHLFLRRDAMVLLLTWAAGGVDAVSYLGLGHVFTANMTGNAVLLGLAVGQGQGLVALRSITALAGFVFGVAIGATIVERSPIHGDWSRPVTQAVTLELIILALFTIIWHLPGASRTGDIYALIASSAVAMGIQSAAIRHLRVPGIATTYITGTLTSMVAGLVGWLRAKAVSLPSARSIEPSVSSTERKHAARLQAAVFVVYVLAAVASGFLQARGSRLVTLSPFAAVTLVAANAFSRQRYESLR